MLLVGCNSIGIATNLLEMIAKYDLFHSNFLLVVIIYRDNYNKPTWGITRFHFAYPWFKSLHFAHLRLILLAFRNPPLHLLLEKYIFRQKQI